MKTHFYAVKVGRNPGIYDSWSECEEQVKGYPMSDYMKFETLMEAKNFLDKALNVTHTGFRTLIAYVGGARKEETLGVGIVCQDPDTAECISGVGTFSSKTCEKVAKWAPYFVGCYHAIHKAVDEHYQQLIICTREPELKQWTQKGYGGYTYMASQFKNLIDDNQSLKIFFNGGDDYSEALTTKVYTDAKQAAANNTNPIKNPLIPDQKGFM